MDTNSRICAWRGTKSENTTSKTPRLLDKLAKKCSKYMILFINRFCETFQDKFSAVVEEISSCTILKYDNILAEVFYDNN